jgi:RNA polymerase sigma-70 factor (ECF subfamily)
MPDEPTFHTTQLHHYLDGIRAGDRQAGEALARAVLGRLERLARCMLHDFPKVRRWADTDDVLQGAWVRLLRAVHALRPASTREFASLMATHIRRELLDLARRCRRLFDPPSAGAADSGVPPPERVPDPGGDASDDLERWAAFHEQVEQLPVQEREVVSLTFYHGWTQADIAALFGVDERTVRRRWRLACWKLSEALGGRLPEV